MTDDDDDLVDDLAGPPITDLDIRVIIARLHDQERSHVLADMIEGVTGERLPDGTFHPRKFPIRDPQWRAERKKLEKMRGLAAQRARRARRTPEEKAASVEALNDWKEANPHKVVEAGKRRKAALKQDRRARPFVKVDLEGFNTGRYFTDDRRDYAREHHERLARGIKDFEMTVEYLKVMMVPDEERPNTPFNGWTVHDHKWYLAQHDLTKDDPYPRPGNRKAGAPEIYIEHRPFLFGAGNDNDHFFIEEGGDVKKIPLSGHKILNTICDLRKRESFKDAVFVTFAFGYDVAQILRCLDADTAGQLQAGEIIIKSTDEDGAPCEETIELATFFWNEFALSYRRGKMFRVGRLKDPANPYTFVEITDPEKRQDYIDAGLPPVKRKIDYKDKDQPVTLQDTFGFFQMSFIEAYENSEISFTLEEAKIIVEDKRKRHIMASLPMDEVKLYQETELRILSRMMNKLRETMISLGLDLPHWMGAGAISSAMAAKHRARDFYPSIKSANHRPEQEWAHYCFAGGRIEMVKQGRHTGEYDPPRPLYGYDITSAYPSIQYGLPAMALPIEWELKKDGSLGNVKQKKEGKWIWREGGELTEDIIRTMSIYSMIEVEFSFPEKCFDQKRGFRGELRKAAFYPLFYRREDGSILFPARGIGRYYRNELLAAFEWVRQSRPDMNEQQHARMIKLRGGYEFVCPTIDDLTPEQLEAIKTNCPSARIGDDGLVYHFHYIKEYYDQRALYPKTDARNKYLKLGINGAWGKTAQSVGGKYGMPPRDASPWYAGVVTAGTRAKCVRAGLKAPWNIIHFATDGMQSDAPLGEPSETPRGWRGIENDKKILGEWEMDTFSRGVYVKPGIYAFVDDFERDPTEEERKTTLDEFVADHIFMGKSRGVGLRSILGEDDGDKKRDIQEEWFEYLDALALDCYSAGRPTAILPHKKLLTFGAAASCAERWPMCGNWIESSRIFKMDTAGVKRAYCRDENRAHSLAITEVATNKTPKVLSAKHKPEWLGDNEALVRDLHENEDLALAHDWDFARDVEDE